MPPIRCWDSLPRRCSGPSPWRSTSASRTLQGAAIINNNLGGRAYFAGDWNAAIDFYHQAQDAYRRAGNEPDAASAGANIGEVLVSQRRLAEAEPILRDASRVLRAHHLVDAIFADMQIARLASAQGRLGTSRSRVS